MKTLVTGGAGFIGSAVVRHIINNTDYTVVNLDKLTYAANLESLTSVSQNLCYAFEQVDICDAQQLKRIFEEYQPDIVFHLAAESHVDRSIESPAAFIQTNIVGTFTLLEQARAYLAKHPQKQTSFRFIHVSTDEVYGDLGLSSIPSDHNKDSSALSQNDADSCHPERSEGSPATFTETSVYKPSSPYSASKAASDHLVQAWWRTYQLPGILVHCSNNYGPHQYTEKLIPKTIHNALNGQPIPIYGNGQQIRDWLYIEDTVKALMAIAEKGKVGQTYNVGGGSEKTNIEIVKTICEILDELVPRQPVHSPSHPEQSEGTKPESPNHSTATQTEKLPTTDTVILSEVEGSPNRLCSTTKDSSVSPQNDKVTSYKHLITHVKDRPGHDMRYAIDASKIQRELGWTPQETFKSGIRKTVQWYLDNQAWYSKYNLDG